MVDYSKWDKVAKELDSDSDEEDWNGPVPSGSPASGGPSGAMANLLRSMNPMAAAMQRGGGPRRKPAYVRLIPEDSGEGLWPIFFTHPDQFDPHHQNTEPWYTDCISCWGIYPAADDVTPQHMMMRSYLRMDYTTKGLDIPEEQFINRLIEKKKKQMADVRPRIEPLFERDFELKITMPMLPVWRTVRCSGGMTLASFHDRVIAPVMGWVRNYHAYFFYDQREGATFGPTKSQAVDMMHINTGHPTYKFMDDSKVKLAEVLHLGRSADRDWRTTPDVTETGEALGCADPALAYDYDLGDRWIHLFKIEKIFSKAESTGAIQCLAGAMACPPEDAEGNRRFSQKLAILRDSKHKEYRETIKSCTKGLNWTNEFPSKPYNPSYFNLQETNARIRKAIESPPSTGSGKHFVTSFGDHDPSSGGLFPRKNEKVLYKPTATPGCVEVETVREKQVSTKDPQAVCSNCGKPGHLQKCGACKSRLYCGKDCQRAHWQAGHKQECKKLQESAAKTTK